MVFKQHCLGGGGGRAKNKKIILLSHHHHHHHHHWHFKRQCVLCQKSEVQLPGREVVPQTWESLHSLEYWVVSPFCRVSTFSLSKCRLALERTASHTHTHTRTHTHTHTHARTRTHTRTHARTRTHTRTHKYNTHTHTHTNGYYSRSHFKIIQTEKYIILCNPC